MIARLRPPLVRMGMKGSRLPAGKTMIARSTSSFTSSACEHKRSSNSCPSEEPSRLKSDSESR